MKRFVLLFVIALCGASAMIAQNAASFSQKASQQYVLYESERDRGGNPATMYEYLYESYVLYMRILDAPDNAQYLQGAKTRLKSMYPIIMNGAIFFANSGNTAKSADFGVAYVKMPKHAAFAKEYLEKDANYEQILYNAALSSYKLQKYAQAQSLFSEYLNDGYTEREKDCYVFLNMIAGSQRDYVTQEQVLLKAIDKYPLSLDFYYNLVNVYIAKKENANIVKTIDKILAIDPNDPKVLPIKARMMESQNKPMEALQAYKRLLNFSPDSYELMTGIARCNYRIAVEINNNAQNILDNTEYEIAKQKAIPYMIEAREMFCKILKSDSKSKQYMEGLLGVYSFMNMTDEYEVLKTILSDNMSYDVFDERLIAYKKEHAQKSTQEGEYIPVPDNPAKLVISFNNIEEVNQNKILDAGEGVSIHISVENKGLGDAYNVRLRLTEQNGFDQYLQGSKEIDGGNIPAGTKKEYTFRYTIDREAPTSEAHFYIYAFEANGFDADPGEIITYTQELSRPRLNVVDHQFMSDDGTSITLEDKGKLALAIQNAGTQTAYKVKVEFKIPKNIIAADDQILIIDSIPSGTVHPIDYSFIVNKRFTEDSVSVVISMTESTNTSYFDHAYKVKLGEYLTSASTLRLDGQLAERKVNMQDFSLSFKSELLEDVPVGKVNPNRYALIIGNEDYSLTGAGSEINVPYAINDALVFKEYCIRTFGIPDGQIKLVANATTGQMHEYLDWLVGISNANPDAELFFYYSGHGSNDEATKEAYLLPVDITGRNVRLGVSIQTLYEKLSKYKTSGVYVFLDACFSGGYKSAAPIIAQKGVRVAPKMAIPSGKIISFASSSGDQTSSVYHEKKQGYYTYYLIKAIKDTKGEITMEQLFSQTRNDVRSATAVLGKIQEPQYMVSSDYGNWQNVSLMKSK